MKRIFLSAVIGWGLCIPLVGMAGGGARLTCDQPIYQFGRIDSSSVVTNVFTVCNRGEVSYLLKYIQTSCSCTKGRMDKRVIAPGETARLTAVFTAARRKGHQKKSLKIIPVDPTRSILTLYLEGFVEASSGKP